VWRFQAVCAASSSPTPGQLPLPDYTPLSSYFAALRVQCLALERRNPLPTIQLQYTRFKETTKAKGSLL
jgi:hypothetical protein